MVLAVAARDDACTGSTSRNECCLLPWPSMQAYDSYMPKWDGQRRAGVILHPTSLPGPYGIGELGGEARSFVDWLVTSGMTCWQMLPLGPPVGGGRRMQQGARGKGRTGTCFPCQGDDEGGRN